MDFPTNLNFFLVHMNNSLLSPNKRGIVVFIDLPDFFQPVDIRLIDIFNPSAAAVVAAGAEFAVNPTGTP